MRTVLHLVFALPVVFAAPRIVPQDVRNFSFPALRDGQPTAVECRSFYYRTATYNHEVLLFRDPLSGAFLDISTSNQQPYRPADEAAATTAISIDRSQMRAFTFNRWLQIRLAQKKAPSLDAVQQTYLESLPAAPPANADLLQMSVWPQTPKVFWESNDGRPASRLAALGRKGRCWSLEIRARNGESETRWLSNEYEMTNVEECDKPPGRQPKVRPVQGSARVFPLRVQRGNLQTSINVHYEALDVRSPEGGANRRVHLYLVYDAVTKLCFRTWTVEMSKTDQHNAQEQIRSMETYRKLVIVKDRMLWFYSTQSGFMASESRERFPTIRAARARALARWEELRLHMPSGQLWFDVAKGVIPSEYFHPCFDAAPFSSRLEGVTYQNGQWRLAVSGPNGNKALVTLNEKLERTAAEFSVPVPEVKLERVLRSGTWPIIRNGQPVEIEYREIEVQNPAFCQDYPHFRPPQGDPPPTLIRTTFRLLFDAATQLSWAETLDEPPPTFVETADQIAAFSLVGSRLMVRPSASRYDNWEQFERDLFEGIRSNGSWGGYHFSIDLKANLTELGQSRPQALRAKATADGWLITITAAEGQSTDVELTHQFRLKGTEVSR